jgi:hypothetical protein
VNECRSCGQPIVWATSKNTGKAMPLDAASKEKRCAVVSLGPDGTPEVRQVDTYLSHFATCDDPERFRRRE